ncbi:MAG: RES domain-containing protein [Butyrivibrio sp.]|nr:RES domain-containing protein [Butyrivibrio sp.]
MSSIYRIYDKKDLMTPLSLYDEFGNCRGIDFSKEEAEQYVNELNEKAGSDTLLCMSLDDWWIMMKKSGVMEKMDEKISEIVNNLGLEEIQKEIYGSIDKNINGFSIPFIADNNEDYEEKLKEKLSAFKEQINRPAFEKEDSLITDVNDICDKVINAFDAVKTGKSNEAEQIVAEILKDYKQYPFAVSELDKSYAFRGVAPFEKLWQSWGNQKNYENMLSGDLSFFRARVVGTREKINEIEEINYLPYSKRLLSKDMRFSSKGKVCLYLGTTSYVCSEECRWNKKDNLYLSSFKFNDKGKRLKILNLVVLQALMNGMIPNDENNLEEKNVHNAMIRVFPLVIATMFTIKTSDSEREKKYNETVKYEYLLSQVLMNVLHKEGIDGVAYLSRQGKDDFQYPQMVCLAIPVTDINSEDEYGDLIKCYEMTKPVLFSRFDENIHFEKKSYINEKWPTHLKYELCDGERENYSAKVDYEGKEVFYQDTPFSIMDNYLVSQHHMKFDEID